MSWLSAEQALAALGTKPQTLYANVSRGRIRSKADPSDTRRSLYNSADVARLAERHAGRRKAAAVATETIHWGDPILASAISTVVNGRLFYRGGDVVRLADHATLSEVAALLWDKTSPVVTGYSRAPDEGTGVVAAFGALAKRAATDLPTLGRSPGALKAEAEGVLDTLIAALTGTGAAPLHQRLATRWRRPKAEDLIRRALVLLADHELNASTFAARVTASTGAPLSAAVLTGLSTLTGPLHGGSWQGVRALVTLAEGEGVAQTLRSYLAQGRPVPSFGHALYPDGDIRAEALISHFALPPIFAEISAVGEEMTGEKPNVDFALAAMAAALKLPAEAPLIIFALARSTGWLAHALEQVAGGGLIRPRARYVGPPLEDISQPTA